MARLAIATEFRPKRTLRSPAWRTAESATSLHFGMSRGRTPEKGGNMNSPVSALAIALLVALLVIDRLAR